MEKSRIIAVDFDGTLCTNNWPDIGEPNWWLIDLLRDCREDGNCKLILWTCRTGDKLDKAVEWCKKYDLCFDAVNENLPELIKEFGEDTRKIFANIYIDDRACNPEYRYFLSQTFERRKSNELEE